MEDVFNWVNLHNDIIKIIGSIIIALLGAWKARKWLINKFNNILKAKMRDNNKNNVGNTVAQTGNKAIQVIGDNNHINSLGKNEIKAIGVSLRNEIYPYANAAFESIQLNTSSFLDIFNKNLSQLSPEELNQFSQADLLLALQAAIKGAGRSDSEEIHILLNKLILDRVTNQASDIVDLVINEAIEVASKLDQDLIKILGLKFVLGEAKYTNLVSKDELFKKLGLIFSAFKDVKISKSRLEYLNGLSCGNFITFAQVNLPGHIFDCYKHLFLRPLTLEEVNAFQLPENLMKICFLLNKDGSYILNPTIGLHLHENLPITLNGMPVNAEVNMIKSKLLLILNSHALNRDEIRSELLTIPLYESIEKIWHAADFGAFALNSNGKAIGRAYVDNLDLGNFDINIWIN